MRLEVGVAGWVLLGADSEVEMITVQEVNWGMLLELTTVEEKRKQDWAEGETELGALQRGRFFTVFLDLNPRVDQSLEAGCPEKGAGH